MRHTIIVASAIVAVWIPAARAEHARINLDVITPAGKKTAFVDQTPPEWGKNPRPVVKAKVGEQIKVDWSFTNIYPHKTLDNVLIYFYVAREGKVGQKELPDLRDERGLIVQSAFEMDFKPDARAAQRQTFKIDQPGIYLIRVESRRSQSDHEHFAAIDLIVEEP